MSFEDSVICFSKDYGVCKFIAQHEDGSGMCDISDASGRVRTVDIYGLQFDRNESYITDALLMDIRTSLEEIKDILKEQCPQKDKPVPCWSCLGNSLFYRWVEKDGEIRALVENSLGEIYTIKPDSIRFRHDEF